MRTASRSAASGVPGAGLPSTPKIPAMITSSVIACIRGASAIVSPTGQRSISRSAAAVIICVYWSIASPWNGGSSSLRWRMWRGPTAVSTELGPRIGRSGDSPVSEGACSGLRHEEGADVVRVAGDDRAAGDHPVHAEDFAELAARLEDELDLTHREAQGLGDLRQRDVGRRRRAPPPRPRRSARPARGRGADELREERDLGLGRPLLRRSASRRVSTALGEVAIASSKVAQIDVMVNRSISRTSVTQNAAMPRHSDDFRSPPVHAIHRPVPVTTLGGDVFLSARQAQRPPRPAHQDHRHRRPRLLGHRRARAADRGGRRRLPPQLLPRRPGQTGADDRDDPQGRRRRSAARWRSSATCPGRSSASAASATTTPSSRPACT